MKIKYFIQPITCIIDWLAQDSQGALYKYYINPDYVIDECAWYNFEKTELLPKPNAKGTVIKRRVMNKYCDQTKFNENVSRYRDTDIADPNALIDLIMDGVLVPSADSFDMTIYKHGCTFQRAPQPSNNPIDNIYILYDSYAEAQAALSQASMAHGEYGDIIMHSPPDLREGVGKIMSRLPKGLEVQWFGHEIVDSITLSPIYSIPERWKPAAEYYPNQRERAIIFIKFMWRIPGINPTRVAIAAGFKYNVHEMDKKLRGCAQSNIQDYIKERRMREVDKLILKNRIQYDEAWRLVGYTDYSYFKKLFFQTHGIHFYTWLREHEIYILNKHKKHKYVGINEKIPTAMDFTKKKYSSPEGQRKLKRMLRYLRRREYEKTWADMDSELQANSKRVRKDSPKT